MYNHYLYTIVRQYYCYFQKASAYILYRINSHRNTVVLFLIIIDKQRPCRHWQRLSMITYILHQPHYYTYLYMNILICVLLNYLYINCFTVSRNGWCTLELLIPCKKYNVQGQKASNSLQYNNSIYPSFKYCKKT